MGLLDILTQLGQATAERARAKEFGADYRQRWQESADRHTLAETQNAVSGANLRAKNLELDTARRAAQLRYPDLDPDAAMAKLEADKYSLGEQNVRSEIDLRGATAGWHRERPDLKLAEIQALGQRATERQRFDQEMQERRLEASKDRAAMMAAATAGREPGAYTWVIGPDGKPTLFNPKSGKVAELPGGEMPKQPPTSEMRGREAAMGRTMPILDQIEGLTLGPNGINLGTEGILGRLGGKVKEAKGYFNLDKQVAEYDSLVQGFIPMVARAAGHTGVLTQQDVDSTRKLFPNPGDSEEIARAKINQVRDILSGKSRFALPSQIGQPTGIGQQPTKPRFQILKVE